MKKHKDFPKIKIAFKNFGDTEKNCVGTGNKVMMAGHGNKRSGKKSSKEKSDIIKTLQRKLKQTAEERHDEPSNKKIDVLGP